LRGAVCRTVDSIYSLNWVFFYRGSLPKNSCTSLYSVGPSLIGKSLPFPSNDPASPGSSTVLPMLPLPRRRPTTLRACGVFARRSLPVVPSSPLAVSVWAGCPSLRSVRLWITGTNVVEWNSRRVTRSTVPRCECEVVMITPGYALAPLTGTPEPANARENPGPGSVLRITRPPSQPSVPML
jgi:hypothetical protein